jgi:hypothetical protein
VCLIQANATFDETLNDLDHLDRNMIERRLFEFANGANVNSPGGLDNPACRVKRFTGELSEVRKITIGRHRIFYKGHHKRCSYQAFAIKPFKKAGVDDEDNPKFQKFLRRALIVLATRQIQKP